MPSAASAQPSSHQLRSGEVDRVCCQRRAWGTPGPVVHRAAQSQVWRASTIGAACSRCSTHTSGVAGSTIGRITNFVVPTSHELVDGRHQRVPTLRHEDRRDRRGPVAVWPARRRRMCGTGPERVGDQRAVVVVVDRAVVLGQPASITSRPRSASAGVTKLGSQPSASRPTLRSSDGAMPPSHTSRCDCRGFGSTRRSS